MLASDPIELYVTVGIFRHRNMVQVCGILFSFTYNYPKLLTDF
jgi:hypothetical protein